MGCCGKNSDDGRTDDVEMRGGAKGKGGKAGKWGEFCTHTRNVILNWALVVICPDNKMMYIGCFMAAILMWWKK